MTEAEHRITVTPYEGTVNVRFSDAMIASTDEALVLREEGHEPVFYIPFDHIYFEFLPPSDTRSRHPFKGEARFWNVEAVGEAADDVMWAYETPDDRVRPIAGHGAFDPDKVTIEATPDESPRESTELA
ncbi:DUF427 domain-containing protein [Nitratireductor thuwali]|uniref:DUF427 domain-containing protein n=1 Tax=Nitratireductor thuwali TaxID=2267699 RepID=A0ABY5MHR1_9HYPH|nr:hypothetical protein NTH_01203 [Nitratireductor thuwali]